MTTCTHHVFKLFSLRAKAADTPDLSFPRVCFVRRARNPGSLFAFVSWCLGGYFLLLILVVMSGCDRHAEIAGPIDTANFVIPADEVVTATADTTINASNKIEIDGTLYLAPGANVTFQSPSVNINGRVQDLSMHVTWWRRIAFTIRRFPAKVGARIDRILGREPRYMDRGAFDCFGPTSRIEPPQSKP